MNHEDQNQDDPTAAQADQKEEPLAVLFTIEMMDDYHFPTAAECAANPKPLIARKRRTELEVTVESGKSMRQFAMEYIGHREGLRTMPQTFKAMGFDAGTKCRYLKMAAKGYSPFKQVFQTLTDVENAMCIHEGKIHAIQAAENAHAMQWRMQRKRPELKDSKIDKQAFDLAVAEEVEEFMAEAIMLADHHHGEAYAEQLREVFDLIQEGPAKNEDEEGADDAKVDKVD